MIDKILKGFKFWKEDHPFPGIDKSKKYEPNYLLSKVFEANLYSARENNQNEAIVYFKNLKFKKRFSQVRDILALKKDYHYDYFIYICSDDYEDIRVFDLYGGFSKWLHEGPWQVTIESIIMESLEVMEERENKNKEKERNKFNYYEDKFNEINRRLK